MTSFDILNDDVLFNILTFQKPSNIIFLNEVNKRLYNFTKKHFKILLFPKKKQIINNLSILNWAYQHKWKNKIDLDILLKNHCSIESLDYYDNKYSFSTRRKGKIYSYYYEIATTRKQLEWLKKKRFRYTNLDISKMNDTNTGWIKDNLIFHQNQLLDYIVTHPNDFEEVKFACENIYDLRIFVHNAAVLANNLPMLEWSVQNFWKEFKIVKEHEDLFILAADKGNIEIGKFLLKYKVPFTGLTLKIAEEENHIDFVNLLTKPRYLHKIYDVLHYKNYF